MRLHENMQEDSPSLEKTRFQFNRLFSRLDALAEICNIHLQEGWSSLDTPLGSLKVSPNGDALIDSTTWDKMKELFFESDVVDSGMFYSNTKTIKTIIIVRKSKEVSN